MGILNYQKKENVMCLQETNRIVIGRVRIQDRHFSEREEQKPGWEYC